MRRLFSSVGNVRFAFGVRVALCVQRAQLKTQRRSGEGMRDSPEKSAGFLRLSEAAQFGGPF